MKRAILKTVKVAPYTSGDAIDREGFLSGVIGVKVGTPTGSPTAQAVKAVFTHSDASDGTFTACGDKLIVLDKALDDDGAVSIETDKAGGELVNIDCDFVGCKRYVKATISVVCTGGSSAACTATAAIALGDKNENPV